MSDTTDIRDSISVSGSSRLDDVMAEVVARRSAGEVLSDEAVIAGHPDLMPELGERLYDLRLIHQAEEQALAVATLSPLAAAVDAHVELRGSDSIPGYEIICEIHRGGQGVVYQAIQKATGRKVAIKVMREGPFAGARDKARFEREVRVLAALNHPNIVGIHDSGTSAGNFYFVMNLIAGETLDAWLDRGERPIEETLKLFAVICEAVNAAHLRGIIHRDLKPGNIRVDGDGQPHVLDFGLAKFPENGDAAQMTVTGQFIGSLPWASPEQAEGVPQRIDTRTDVYSLGVILYQMLTGRFPYEVVGNMRDVLDRILKSEPARPSTIRRQIDDEVETIVLKCLAKEQDRRYQSAGELARDIRRYLAGEPIEAKRDSTLYVLRKTLSRYRLAVAVAAGFVLLITASLFASLTLWRQAVRQRDGAIVQRNRADRQTTLAEHRERIGWRHAYAAGVASAYSSIRAGEFEQAEELLDWQRPIFGREDIRGFEWYYLWRSSRPNRLDLRGEHSGVVYATTVSPDGKWLGSGGDNGKVIVWDTTNWERSKAFKFGSSAVYELAFSPDGRRLFACTAVGQVRIVDIESGTDVRSWQAHDGPAFSCALSPDGRTLATCGDDKTVRLWDPATGSEKGVLTGHQKLVHSVRFSPDGGTLASASFDGTVALWSVPSGDRKVLETAAQNQVWAVAFSGDGTLLAAGGSDGIIYLWPTGDHHGRRLLRGHQDEILYLTFASNSHTLASGGRDRTVRLWDADTGQESRAFAQSALVRALAFTPDGTRLAVGMGSTQLSVLDVGRDHELATLRGHGSHLTSVDFSPDGTQLASASEDRTVMLWKVPGYQPERTMTEHGVRVNTVRFSPQGEWVASGDANATVLIWDRRTGRRHLKIDTHLGEVRACAFSPSGDMLATAGDSPKVILWSIASGERRLVLHAGEGSVYALAFSPDGRYLAAGGDDTHIRVWNAATGEQVHTLRGGWQEVRALDFSRDGRLLASGTDHMIYGMPPEVVLWDYAAGRKVLVLTGHSSGVRSLAFSPDGKTMATGSRDASVKLWDLVTGEERITLRGHSAEVYGVAFSPDGLRLAAAGVDRTLRVWEAATRDNGDRSARAAFGHYRLAGVLIGRGETAEAEQLLRQAVRLGRQCMDVKGVAFARFQSRLGAVLSTGGDPAKWSEAETLLNTALAVLEAGVPLYSRREALEALALLYGPTALNRPERHRATREEATVAGSDWFDLRFRSWTVVKHAGKSQAEYETAWEQARNAHRLLPDFEGFLLTLGMAQYRSGRYAEALTTLQRSHSIYPGDSIAVAFLAMTLHALGREAEAHAAFERAKALMPSAEKDEETQAIFKEAAALLGVPATYPAPPASRPGA